MPSFGGEPSVGGTVVWLTPPYIIEALGPFDLDPCAPADGERPFETAASYWSEEQDGLVQPWRGRVWMNPPYGPGMDRWLVKLAEHGDGYALVFARTETRAFFDGIWDHADALFFFKGRLKYHRPDGTPGQVAQSPSVLAAYGSRNVRALEAAVSAGKLTGKLVYLK
jgi:hypothetical protein